MDNNNKKQKVILLVNYDNDENKDENKNETISKNLVEGKDFKKLQKHAIPNLEPNH